MFNVILLCSALYADKMLLGSEKHAAQQLDFIFVDCPTPLHNSNSKNTNRITPNAAAIAVDAAYAQPIVLPRGESCHYNM